MSLKAKVEISMGSRYKYEVDKVTGELTVDRPLTEPIPYNYGYIENTLYKDGDPLDVCIIGKSPIMPLATAKVIPIGAFICNDNGAQDDKLVAYVEGDSLTGLELAEKVMEVKHYLSSYKEGFVVQSYEDIGTAFDIYEWSLENAKTS